MSRFHIVPSLAALVLVSSSALAGTYTHNFNSLATDTPNGAINTAINLTGGLLNGVAGNSQIISSKKDTNGAGTINVAIVKTNVGTGLATALRLADKVTSSCNAALIIPVLDGASATISEFTVTLDMLMDKTAGATPADGFNISFGQALSGVGGSGGHSTGYGLIVNFDTYQNSATDPRSIEIISDGVTVGNFLATGLPGANFTYDQTFRALSLHWDSVNGLDLTYGGQTIFDNLPTPGFVPLAGSNFALNTGTGGLYQDVFLDNLSITTVATVPPAPIATADVVIEELMADNADGLEDEDLDHPDWIELYNGTGASVALAGWKLRYQDATAVPPIDTTWTLPTLTISSNGYQTIFASGKDKFGNVRPHTNFTLRKEGGTLTLLRPDGTTVADTLTYGQQQEDTSYGKLDAAQTLGFFDTPTPGVRNTGNQAANFRLQQPVFDLPSGVLTAGTTLTLSLPAGAPAGAEIRYTTNGIDPLPSSPVYSAPIAVSGSNVKAKVFAAGHLPSRTGNRSFILLGTAATNNVGTNYNGSGQAFSSSLPVLVLDSYTRNVDALTNPAGLRPYRFTQAAVYDVNPGTGRASLGSAPNLISRAATHVRGQSSSGQAERPYALEFWKDNEDTDQSVPLLGWPADSDWVLMTLTLDKTLMRNWLMQQLMLDANGPGTGVRCRFVEVFFNQDNGTLDYLDYRGVYLLMEKISRGNERVNVAKLNDSMSAPALINGGYIVKNDKTPYEARFNPNSNGAIPGSSRDYDIYDPEPPTTTQINAIKTWFDQMTTALANVGYNNPANANYYGNWLDTHSFIDKTLWLELCKEVDAYTFSYYFSKDRNGPLRAFPFWDVDRGLGNSNYGNSNASYGSKWWYVGSNYTYYTRLDDDPEFNDRYWNRWWALRRSLFAKDALFNRIETLYAQLSEGSLLSITNSTPTTLQVPIARHYRKYPILGTNSFGSGITGQANRTTWRQEVDAMKIWLGERLEWIDSASPLRAPTLLDAATGLPKYGGNVPVGHQFRFDNPNTAGGTVLYTLNGPDPRQTGGVQDPAALTGDSGTVAASTILASAQSWKWLLPAAAPASTWINAAFDDSAWGTGTAPLGYGESSGLTTNISPTAPNYTNASTEPNAAYFRSTFTASGVGALTGALLEIVVDDGATIWLNGQELVRVNYPPAPTLPSLTQEASGPIDPGNNKSDTEQTFYKIYVDHTKLINGTNTIAVQVNQAIYSFPGSAVFPGNTLSDLRFDLRLTGLTATPAATAYTLSTPGAHTVRARIKNGATWGPLTEATFVVSAAPAAAANLVVSEFHYHPSNPTAAELALGFNNDNDFEYLELLNTSATDSVDLTGVTLENAVSFNFNTAPPAARFLPPGGRVVVVENALAFASRVPAGLTPVVAGVFSGNFSNNTETVIVRAANGTVIRQFTYNDSLPWPSAADGFGYSVVLNAPGSNPDHNVGANWHASAEATGRPGGSDHAPFPAGQSWDADGDLDGLSDGIEYSMGSGGADPALPGFDYSSYDPPGEGGWETYLHFTYRRNLQAEGVIFEPEVSGDLSAWSGTGFTRIQSFHNGDGTSTEVCVLNTPASALPGRFYLRLRVRR